MVKWRAAAANPEAKVPAAGRSKRTTQAASLHQQGRCRRPVMPTTRKAPTFKFASRWALPGGLPGGLPGPALGGAQAANG